MKDGLFAFPSGIEHENTGDLDYPINQGMTLRDYFAAKALTGMYSTAAAPCLSGLDGHEKITADAAYKMADAMLKARQ